MQIIYKNITLAEKETAFKLFKTCMYPIIDKELGWDELFQRSGFYNNYQTPWLYWVIVDNTTIGLVCLREKAQYLHVHLVIVFEQYQRQGFGKGIFSDLQNSLESKLLGISLSSFKSNKNALNLYQKMGFSIVAQDNYFYRLTWEITDS